MTDELQNAVLFSERYLSLLMFIGIVLGVL